MKEQDMSTANREPYVGTGEDGARRSARIDREEAGGLSWSDERRDTLLESAERWEQQAYELTLARVGRQPSLAQVREGVGSEEWLAALALLDLSPAVAGDAEEFTLWSQDGGQYTYEGEGEDRVGTFHPDAEMDWEAWVNDVDEHGRGWSSTEHRIFELVAALTVRDRKVALVGVLDLLGSWEHEALTVLVQWATGGNQRDLAGRLTVVTPTGR